jgi:hypothetical protein
MLSFAQNVSPFPASWPQRLSGIVRLTANRGLQPCLKGHTSKYSLSLRQ